MASVSTVRAPPVISLPGSPAADGALGAQPPAAPGGAFVGVGQFVAGLGKVTGGQQVGGNLRIDPRGSISAGTFDARQTPVRLGITITGPSMPGERGAGVIGQLGVQRPGRHGTRATSVYFGVVPGYLDVRTLSPSVAGPPSPRALNMPSACIAGIALEQGPMTVLLGAQTACQTLTARPAHPAVGGQISAQLQLGPGRASVSATVLPRAFGFVASYSLPF